MSDNNEVREASGQVTLRDAFASFLYVVMRDGCPTGVVEEALSQTTKKPVLYSNGWLARYCENVSERLRDKLGLVRKSVDKTGWVHKFETRVYKVKVKKAKKDYDCEVCKEKITSGESYLNVEYRRCDRVFNVKACTSCEVTAWKVEKLHEKRISEHGEVSKRD